MPSILGVWETGKLLLWEGFVIGRFAAILGFGPPLGFRALADLELEVVSKWELAAIARWDS